MGSTCSPVIANLFIERFEQPALSSATNPPKIWLRYVDDTFLILKKDQVDDFTSHINLIDPNIKFITEPNNKKSSAKDKPIGPSNSSATGRNPFVVLPYLEGLSQRLRRSFEGFWMKTIFKPHRTLRQQLVAPKHKSDHKDLSGVVYRIACKDYNKVYIAESVRAFADWLKEHNSNSLTTIKTSVVAKHRALAGHKTEFDNITILDRGVKNTQPQNQGVYFYPQIKESQPKLNKYDCNCATLNCAISHQGCPSAK